MRFSIWEKAQRNHCALQIQRWPESTAVPDWWPQGENTVHSEYKCELILSLVRTYCITELWWSQSILARVTGGEEVWAAIIELISIKRMTQDLVKLLRERIGDIAQFREALVPYLVMDRLTGKKGGD